MIKGKDSPQMDRLNMKCLECGKGRYVEASMYADWDGVLNCNMCRASIKRWGAVKVTKI